MTKDPLEGISTRQTSQSQPVPGRTDQVRNSAGGFVFQIDDWARLRRFLVLGTQGGTYYTRQGDLTRENAAVLFKLIESDGLGVVKELVTVSTENLAPRVQPTLFALAACSGAGNPQTRAAALDALPAICRTASHLHTFIKYAEQFRGWGRGLRTAVSAWYMDKSLDDLAYQLIKYQQRDGWSNGDLLRLSHPLVGNDTARHGLFRYVLGRDTSEFDEMLPRIVEGVRLAHAAGDDTKKVAKVITDYGLPWEAVPSETLRDPKVWEALLPKMGLTALIRNLGRMTNIGMLKPMTATTSAVVRRIRDAQGLTKSRVHPFQVLLALTTYQAGRGVRGSLMWTPVREVVDALDMAFYASFGNVKPANKRTMVALDVSGSMTFAAIMDTHLTPRAASAAMALVTLNAEPSTMTVAFTSGGGRGSGAWQSLGCTEFTMSPRQRIDDVIRATDRLPWGRTDCAQPMLYAQANKLDVETFVIYTDNETWSGNIHPFQALKNYRQHIGHDAKLVVVGMTSTGFSIADPSDPGMMDVVGFDASAPNVISDFSAGLV